MDFLAIAFSTLLSLGPSVAPFYYHEVDPSQVIKILRPAPEDAVLPDRVRVLVWNIQKATHGQNWREDFARIGRTRNLTLLQEGMDDSTVTESLHQNMSWLMAQSFHDTDKKASTGVITGSWANPTSVIYRKSPGKEPIVKTPKMTLFTVYSLSNGASLLAVNIHALNFVVNSEFYKQIEDMLKFIRHYTETYPQAKVLVAGDFNTWNPARTLYLADEMSRLGFKEAAFKYDDRYLVLDHVFVKGCKIESTEIFDWIESSDHWPLAVNVDCAIQN